MVVSGFVLRRWIALLPLLLVLISAGFVQRLRSPAVVAPTPTTQAATMTPAAAITFIAPTPRPTEAPRANPAPYPIYGPGVELRNDVWLNTAQPLRLADLRGRVVLLSFWAFDCLPCLPTLANVRDWYDAYAAQGLTVIGVHHPKVDAERSYAGLVAALTRLDVPYPVAQDNDGLTWSAYGQHVWPTLTLLDKRGYLRYQQVGAGGAAEMETAIRALLAEGA